jgi:hypothetical protein
MDKDASYLDSLMEALNCMSRPIAPKNSSTHAIHVNDSRTARANASKHDRDLKFAETP